MNFAGTVNQVYSLEKNDKILKHVIISQHFTLTLCCQVLDF